MRVAATSVMINECHQACPLHRHVEPEPVHAWREQAGPTPTSPRRTSSPKIRPWRPATRQVAEWPWPKHADPDPRPDRDQARNWIAPHAHAVSGRTSASCP